MTHSHFFRALLAVFLVTIIGDVLWHNWLLHDFYYARVDAINGAPTPDKFPFYIVLAEIIAAVGTTFFVLSGPHLPTMADGVFRGALLGLMMAGSLNLVNHTLLVHWDLTVAVIDVLWGIILGGIGGAVCVKAAYGKTTH